MPAPTEFSIDAILNRVFVSATNKIAASGDSGDNAPVDERTPQEILNLCFNATTNRLNLSTS
jgi:hypothetical protein